VARGHLLDQVFLQLPGLQIVYKAWLQNMAGVH